MKSYAQVLEDCVPRNKPPVFETEIRLELVPTNLMRLNVPDLLAFL